MEASTGTDKHPFQSEEFLELSLRVINDYKSDRIAIIEAVEAKRLERVRGWSWDRKAGKFPTLWSVTPRALRYFSPGATIQGQSAWLDFRKRVADRISRAWKDEYLKVVGGILGDDVAGLIIGGCIENVDLDDPGTLLPAKFMVAIRDAFKAARELAQKKLKATEEALNAKRREASIKDATPLKEKWQREKTLLVMQKIATAGPDDSGVNFDFEKAPKNYPVVPEWYDVETKESMSPRALINDWKVGLRDAGYTVVDRYTYTVYWEQFEFTVRW